jgi:hypothetical protein
VLILRLLRSFFPRLTLITATALAIGAGMVFVGPALAKRGSRLVELGVVLLVTGSIQVLPLLAWTIRSLRTARELLADPDTQITFRDNEVLLYRPEIKIREKITVHNRPAESETTIRPAGYVSLPSWIMDDPQRYGITLPPTKPVEK